MGLQTTLILEQTLDDLQELFTRIETLTAENERLREQVDSLTDTIRWLRVELDQRRAMEPLQVQATASLSGRAHCAERAFGQVMADNKALRKQYGTMMQQYTTLALNIGVDVNEFFSQDGD